MAHTVSADKSDEEYREYVDSPEDVANKISQLAELVQKHRGKVVVYTGAGISTGAGIPDFRSGLNSKTGMPAGKWCQNATSGQWDSKEKKEEEARQRRTTSCLQAIPTQSHMALVELQRQNVLLGLISQNCDGLHRRSGFAPDHLAELHGNTNLEYCGWCGKEYMRDFRASTGRRTQGRELRQKLWRAHSKLELINPRKGNHYTGRRCQCQDCPGYLFDSTIDFGDNLPTVHINRGFSLADQAGLCIVLGSRCSVSPACDMPISVGESGRDLVVVNLQKTSADKHACLRIGATIDEVMVPLMAALGIPIPEFALSRQIAVTRKDGAISVRGVDVDGTPNDLLWNLQARYGHDSDELLKGHVEFNQDASGNTANGTRPGDRARLLEWPWEKEDGRAGVEVASGARYCVSPDTLAVCDEVVVDCKTRGGVRNVGSRTGRDLEHVVLDEFEGKQCSAVWLMFRCHYREPPVRLAAPADGSETLYRIDYSPSAGTWGEPVVLSHDGPAPMETVSSSEPMETGVEGVGLPAAVSEDHSVCLHVTYQDQSSEGKYRCFHQLQVQSEAGVVASVKYSMPGQGFKNESVVVRDSPFQMKFGPCWGRPHVTVDLSMADGTTIEGVFSENLPAEDARINLPLHTSMSA